MMTIESARESIGRKVVYRLYCGTLEEGVITSVNDVCVFVRYGADSTSKGTRAEDLSLI